MGKPERGTCRTRKISCAERKQSSSNTHPTPRRLAVKCAVAGVVNHVKMLVHDQQGELERLQARHSRPNRLAGGGYEGWAQIRRHSGEIRSERSLGNRIRRPRFPRLVEHLNDCQALLSGVRKGESPARDPQSAKPYESDSKEAGSRGLGKAASETGPNAYARAQKARFRILLCRGHLPGQRGRVLVHLDGQVIGSLDKFAKVVRNKIVREEHRNGFSLVG